MEKITTTIVSQLLAKLSKDRKYYTQKNLSDYGYPQFLIKRITFHLMRVLSNEFTLPGEEWLNRESDELHAEWAELQRTIKREIHLPAYLAKEIIEKSVKECVGMTIQPRKVIPELLFEDQNELDANELTERSSAITVNRLLVWSMIRYMEKKNRESLKKADAARILESIESKIVEDYHPLNWLSLVKPLFELSGSTVHSDLFRRFFEYKGKNHLAKEFDMIDDEIKESRFIEILSSPNSIHVEGYKDDQQTLFKEDVNGDAVEIEDSNEVLDEKQDELIEDRPIFQSFRAEPEEEPGELEEDSTEGEEQIEDLTDAKPIYLSVREEPEEESELEGENEEELDLVSKFEEEEDTIEEQTEFKPIYLSIDERHVEDSDQSDESEEENGKGLVLESEEEEEEDEIESIEKEDKSDLIKDIEEEHASDSEPDHTKADVQDEELIAPWEDEEEEGAFTFIRHDEDEDDDEVIEDERVLSKMEEPVSDAALLEIEDEEPEEEHTEVSAEEDKVEEENSSLLNRFMFDEADLEETLGDISSEGDKKVTTIYDELNLKRNDVKPETMDLFGTLETPEIDKKPFRLKPDEKGKDTEMDESDKIRKFSEFEDTESDEDSGEPEVPMWRSFLERDENEAKSAFQFDDESESDVEETENEDTAEKLDEDGFFEEPIYDFTKKEVDLDEKIGDLSHWMKDVREKFIEDLFGDSEDAYEQALSDIMEFDDWKNASKYIEKEIFARNRIDVYDEIAVDFTDRLHSYFIENKS